MRIEFEQRHTRLEDYIQEVDKNIIDKEWKMRNI